MSISSLRALWAARISSSSFKCSAFDSRFCAFWIRKTIKNVTIVVPVLMTSCQLLEKWQAGPSNAQTTTADNAVRNPQRPPVTRIVQPETLVNRSGQAGGISGFAGPCFPETFVMSSTWGRIQEVHRNGGDERI